MRGVENFYLMFRAEWAEWKADGLRKELWVGGLGEDLIAEP
jgi:hypothetical protein